MQIYLHTNNSQDEGEIKISYFPILEDLSETRTHVHIQANIDVYYSGERAVCENGNELFIE